MGAIRSSWSSSGRWFARTHTEVQQAPDLYVLYSAFDAAQLERIHAAEAKDDAKSDRAHPAVRRLVRSEKDLEMAIRKEVETALASQMAMRALFRAVSPDVMSAPDGVPLPFACARPTTKRDRVGVCLRCHSKGGEAPTVLPFAPENITAWREAFADGARRKETAELAARVLERIRLPPDDPEAMPPSDSVENALFYRDATGARRTVLVGFLERSLKSLKTGTSAPASGKRGKEGDGKLGPNPKAPPPRVRGHDESRR